MSSRIRVSNYGPASCLWSDCHACEPVTKRCSVRLICSTKSFTIYKNSLPSVNSLDTYMYYTARHTSTQPAIMYTLVEINTVTNLLAANEMGTTANKEADRSKEKRPAITETRADYGSTRILEPVPYSLKIPYA